MQQQICRQTQTSKSTRVSICGICKKIVTAANDLEIYASCLQLQVASTKIRYECFQKLLSAVGFVVVVGSKLRIRARYYLIDWLADFNCCHSHSCFNSCNFDCWRRCCHLVLHSKLFETVTFSLSNERLVDV